MYQSTNYNKVVRHMIGRCKVPEEFAEPELAPTGDDD
jgi:hypothetical protein